MRVDFPGHAQGVGGSWNKVIITHGIAKYARTYIRDTHTQAHTQKKKTGKGGKKKEKKERGREMGF